MIDTTLFFTVLSVLIVHGCINHMICCYRDKHQLAKIRYFHDETINVQREMLKHMANTRHAIKTSNALSEEILGIIHTTKQRSSH